MNIDIELNSYITRDRWGDGNGNGEGGGHSRGIGYGYGVDAQCDDQGVIA